MVLQPVLWAPKTWVLKGFCWVPQFVNICTCLGAVPGRAGDPKPIQSQSNEIYFCHESLLVDVKC